MPDLPALWQQHTDHEFVTRDVEATLDTMVDDAYVNHIPVMTGGRGKDALRAECERLDGHGGVIASTRDETAAIHDKEIRHIVGLEILVDH